ncbi:Piso0_005489 [Millerozyma farinosa CBS 7064]|uniref:Piso0_005489 protein n=1 Tax=Pichia sorbitophila (strain ATCC MYA-4447 / BCRC 22081 / CBS 7064 / NBRC 10061 / NRRL Y-12695) TaxID=559304 RepID=G8Y585_PICSO|nr:Piso0_005489 [Millerozyma farinosa CBS 7064]
MFSAINNARFAGQKSLNSITKDFQRGIAMKGDVHLSNRRVMRKIRLGKARPAIFYQFDTLVELSDGSVIKRRSQAPRDEIRMINDQRSSSLWNPHRSDLSSVDSTATGRISKFRQRFAAFEADNAENADDAKADGKVTKEQDSYIELMGRNVQEVQKGGKIASKKSGKKK